MKKSIFVFGLLLGASIFTTENTYSQGDLCGSQDGYGIYQCRVENICEQYVSEKPVYNSQDYPAAQNAVGEFQGSQSATLELDAAKKLYRENIGNIYKCAIIQSQINTLDNLKTIIGEESSGMLSDTIGGQIDLRINRLDISSSTIGCTLSDTQSIQNKLNILHETTYQACKHISYLEYLKSYYEKTGNLMSDEQERADAGNNFTYKVTPEQISNDINQQKNAVAEEISHTYQVFPIAYHAYSEYENNFPIHFLLEVVRADFILLRENLRDNLMPIAQLGLKIINAMSQ